MTFKKETYKTDGGVIMYVTHLYEYGYSDALIAFKSGDFYNEKFESEKDFNTFVSVNDFELIK